MCKLVMFVMIVNSFYDFIAIKLKVKLKVQLPQLLQKRLSIVFLSGVSISCHIINNFDQSLIWSPYMQMLFMLAFYCSEFIYELNFTSFK